MRRIVVYKSVSYISVVTRLCILTDSSKEIK